MALPQSVFAHPGAAVAVARPAGIGSGHSGARHLLAESPARGGLHDVREPAVQRRDDATADGGGDTEADIGHGMEAPGVGYLAAIDAGNPAQTFGTGHIRRIECAGTGWDDESVIAQIIWADGTGTASECHRQDCRMR